jgi:hypothetical protein
VEGLRAGFVNSKPDRRIPVGTTHLWTVPPFCVQMPPFSMARTPIALSTPAINGMPAWAPFVLWVSFMVAVAVVSHWLLRRRRERREAELAQAARTLGLTELPQNRGPLGLTLAMDIPPGLRDAFETLRGMAMTGPVCAFTRHDSDGEAYFFDMVISGQRSETFAAFHYAGADFPHFRLKPEYLAMPLFGKFGSLKFPEFPEFSRCYVLSGEDKAGVRALFAPEILRSFENLSAKPCSIESCGEWLLIYRKAARVEPDELPGFVETTTKIAGTLHPPRE